MAGPRRAWQRTELLVAFHLYCRTPFGRMHKTNPEIETLAQALGRTPSSIAMKLVNFASLDPVQRARGVRGLEGASKADRELFEHALANWESVVEQAQAAWERLPEGGFERPERFGAIPTGPSEVIREVKVRRLQGFFREAVIASYDNACAVSGIRMPELLTASHIVPWARNEARRADPRNGIALSALHDRAFDRGLITIDDQYRVVVSKHLRVSRPTECHRMALVDIHGRRINMPTRFAPDPDALRWHREHVFKDE